MEINRQTYEEFFLLYTDGELNADEKLAVETFISENPDLGEELMLMQQTIFTPDDSIIFENKELLLKKEEERKVIPFNWFRIAVAAILLISFGIFGWLYLDNKQTMKTEAVADVVPEKNKPSKTVGPPAVVAPEPGNTPSVQSENKVTLTKGDSNRSFVSQEKNIRKTGRTKTEKKEEIPTVAPPANTPPPDHADFDNEVVITGSGQEEIEIPVEPRDIATINDTEKEEAANNISNTRYEYGESTDNNTIYFANTTLPKKNKLRVVFRKATRIIDKVTSSQ